MKTTAAMTIYHFATMIEKILSFLPMYSNVPTIINQSKNPQTVYPTTAERGSLQCLPFSSPAGRHSDYDARFFTACQQCVYRRRPQVLVTGDVRS